MVPASPMEARQRAEKAARALEDINPFLADMERRWLSAAVNQQAETHRDDAKVDRLLARVFIIRSLRGELLSAIEQGKIAAQKEDAADDAEKGISPFA